MQVPDKVMPVFLKKIISVLPAKPPAWVLVNTLNQLLRREILLADMSLLAGRHCRIAVLILLGCTGLLIPAHF
ncbi:hypothetical protein SASC598O11_002400, partial [Snodgrassella alvi SCGC AB-598-O11]